jgi:hypothetical protein
VLPKICRALLFLSSTLPKTSSIGNMTTGRFHTYWPERYLKVFEHLPADGSGNILSVQDTPNIVLFIPGLFDTFASVPYVAKLASVLADTVDNTYSVMEIQLTSIGVGFGTGDLNRDVEEIGKCVEWLRSTLKSRSSKVVLMGHSTGSQDVLHYLYYGSDERPCIDGAILQAPVSDREGLDMVLKASDNNESNQRQLLQVYDECVKKATELQSDPEGPSLPRSLTSKLGFMHAFLSASRFLSLASPGSPSRPSLDDLFSSDLPDSHLNTTFGMVGSRGRLTKTANGSKESILVLMSSADEHVPSSVDKEALLARWEDALENGGTKLAPSSGVVGGAKHNGESLGEGPSDLVDRCLQYLRLVEGGSGHA